ncbi:uncharacterized protein [Chironomus tepperi]|uniref:uncharacterized protein n=1 Tax=Chironomus tepperi TaxID=113505 RepID=UPI00391F6DA4
MSLIILIILLIICYSLARKWLNQKFSFWSDRGFLQGDPTFPFGTLDGVGFKMTNHEKYDYYYKKFKGKAPAVGLYHFLSPVLLVLDTELLKNIFVRDFASFHGRGLYHNKEHNPVGANTFTLSGQEWRDRRVKLTPIFTSGKMKMMFELLDELCEKLVQILDNQLQFTNELEMRSWLQRFTIDTIGNVAFGIDPNALEHENSELAYFAKKLSNITFTGIVRFMIGSEWPSLAKKLKIGFTTKDVNDYFLKIFVETLERREKSNIKRNDFVSLLLGLKDEYTKEELAAEAFIIFFGGFETSSSLMTFLLYELALNPDMQDRLREEIMNGIDDNDGKLTYDMMFGFKYLDMFVNEGLRKYPPIPSTMRKTNKEYPIPGTKLVIPEGIIVPINSFSFQHDPEYFPDPEKFDPERFNDENIKNIKPFTNIPFGEGPRICMGMRFGLMQSKIGITKIIKNFVVQPSEKTQIPIKFSLGNPLLAPEKGMWLRFTRIHTMGFILGILTTLIICCSLAYQWVKKRFRFWSDRGFLQDNPSFPLGNLSGVGTKTTNAEKIDYYYKKFKGKAPAIGLYNFLSPAIIPIDPELVKNILVRDFNSFHDRGLFYNKRDDPIGANTLTLDGHEWRDRRVKLTPIFTSGKMKMMFELIDVLSDKMVRIIDDQLQKGNDLEMRSWLQRFTIDSIGNVAFGIEPNCLENENAEFGYYGKKLANITLGGIIKFIFGTEWPDIARKLGLGFTPKDVGDFFLKTFIQTIDYREKSNIKRTDFVSLLLGLKDEYTKEELAAEAFIIFFGGFETSSSLMTFLLYELALNPDVQDRLREEIVTGLDENDDKLTYDLLLGFKYLDMVVNEGLRKYPPIPTPIRKCTKEYYIPDSNLVIPEGTVVLINAFSFQRDPEYFPEPEKFNPERFSADNVRNIKPFTNIPFGDGPRNCIGMRFGLMQSKIGIVKLIKNFVIQPAEGTQIPLKFNPTSPLLAPEKGMWLKITKI